MYETGDGYKIFLFQRRKVLRNSQGEFRASRQAYSCENDYLLQSNELLSFAKL